MKSEATRQKIRLARLGKHWSIEIKKKMSDIAKAQKRMPPSRKGTHLKHPISEETKRKISLSKIGKPSTIRGEKHHWWKGGKTSITKRIRSSTQYQIWRRAVFERDNWTCRICEKRGGQLEADHIIPISIKIELCFAIDNGRTLCKECHKLTDTYGRKLKK